MYLANHHAHSHFSDGRLGPEDYVKNAIAQQLSVYGFSDHAPIPGVNFGAMALTKLPEYLREIDQLRDQYGHQIQLYKSLEVDYIPDVINIDSDHIREAKLDYTIGAVHYVDYFSDGRPWGFESSAEQFQRAVDEIFEGDVERAVGRYYELIREMVEHRCPDIVAHLDRIKKLNQGERFFSEKTPWYRKAVIETLEAVARSGAIMEVNTKGLYKNELDEPYPGRWVLEIARELGIPVHIGSDAHHPDDIVKGFDPAVRLLREVGYENTRIFLNGEWQEVTLAERTIHSHLYHDSPDFGPA